MTAQWPWALKHDYPSIQGELQVSCKVGSRRGCSRRAQVCCLPRAGLPGQATCPGVWSALA